MGFYKPIPARHKRLRGDKKKSYVPLQKEKGEEEKKEGVARSVII
jgi:hypothetical protein